MSLHVNGLFYIVLNTGGVTVTILEFPIRSTRKKDECVILKFYPLRFSDSEPWDPIFISLACAEALDREGEEKAP